MTLKVTQNRKRIDFKREACTEAYTEALRHSRNLCNYLYQRTLIFPEILHTSGTLETSKRFLSFLLYAVLLGFSCGSFSNNVQCLLECPSVQFCVSGKWAKIFMSSLQNK